MLIKKHITTWLLALITILMGTVSNVDAQETESQRITYGETISAEIDECCEVYTVFFEADSGVTVNMAVTNADFDAGIEVYYDRRLVAEDDDSGAGDLPLLTDFTPEYSDTYQILVVRDGSLPEDEYPFDFTLSRAPEDDGVDAEFTVDDCPNLICEFDAASSDLDGGTFAGARWEFGDGETLQAGPLVTHQYSSPGTYEVSVTILVDSAARSDTETRSINVGVGSGDPIASFQVDCDDLACEFDAGDSTDPDGEIVEYEWNIPSYNSTGFGSEWEYIFAFGGTYNVSLTVTDDDGQTSETTKSVDVESDGFWWEDFSFGDEFESDE